MRQIWFTRGYLARLSQIPTWQACARSAHSVFCAAALVAVAGVVVGAGRTSANTQMTAAAFQAWVQDFRRDALTKGISPQTFDAAFAKVKAPAKSVVKSVSTQPEVVRTSGDYVSSLVSDGRVQLGREKLEGHRALLSSVESAFGVDARVVVALWGVETYYGRLSGKHSIIQSLATLAATHRRRAKYWRAELLAALKIIEGRHVTAENFKGSWAGAMGHIQFMPTTYHSHAVDFDRDGRRDIWDSKADALASASKFLKAKGWVPGEPWGFEVRLPENFDFDRAGPDVKLPLITWQKKAVVPAKGIGWPEVNGRLRLLLPEGASGPAFLVTQNFSVLMRYNPSTRYALAVAHLSDRIAGAPDFAQAWPSAKNALRRGERKELQRLLSAKGHNIGPVDGIIGATTREAIRAFQKVSGLPADGHPSQQLLSRLRTASNN